LRKPAGGDFLDLMRVLRLDHLVLTVASVPATLDFYENVLGLRPLSFGDGRRALAFGDQKINLHQADRLFEPKATLPTPGSADLCFIVDDIEAAARRLAERGVRLEEGPVARTGALGPILSLYLRDPDGNLIELSEYQEE
jgi:catechol 2,3-dioxygenase-like lactoylglutathione lyase family enzyme